MLQHKTLPLKYYFIVGFIQNKGKGYTMYYNSLPYIGPIEEEKIKARASNSPFIHQGSNNNNKNKTPKIT